MKISAYHKKLGDNVTFVKGINESTAYEFWDRIYISTLFTYHWKVTTDTIKYYKNLVRGDLSRIIVGGIMASLMPNELWEATGIKPVKGVLGKSGVLDDDTKFIVENMIPDYELFDEAYQRFTYQNYSLIPDSYFGYSTRGCPHKCDFCGVPLLEPRFKDYRGIKTYVKKIENLYGQKTHLVLFDNNILFSKKFEKIINDIIDLGFYADAKISYKNKAGATTYKQRHVDFNQGTDARYMKRWNVKLLSKIAIHPLRIAFDSIKLQKTYIKSVTLAAEHGIRNLSNYILYNYKDTPNDFWQRLKINIDLNMKYNLNIYSFPMKYIPLKAKDRKHIDEPRWNWQFIRNVQRILNVVKGSVMPGEDFFYRAFGENEKDFITILHMPENILMNRGREQKQEEKSWREKFHNLTQGEKKELLSTLCNNKTARQLISASVQTKSLKLKNILEYYLPNQHHKDNLSLFDKT